MFFILLLFLLICFYLSAICPNLSRKKEMEPFFNTEFAHRGLFSDNKNIPENSMKAFQEAVKQHVGIELDVHLTSDGKAVVFHDDTLTRMCHRDEVIEKMKSENECYVPLNNFDETQLRIMQDYSNGLTSSKILSNPIGSLIIHKIFA